MKNDKNQTHTGMKKSIILLSSIFVWISCSGFSQVQEGAGRKSFGFQIGGSHVELREESLNRATHKGPGLAGAFYLERACGKSLKSLNLELGTAFLGTGYEDEMSSFRFSGSASFSYLRKPGKGNAESGFLVGGKLKAASAITYFDNWDESHYYWLTAYSFGPDLRFTCPVGSHGRLQFDADFPVLSMISRPPVRFLFTQSSPAFADVLRDLNQDLGWLTPVNYRNINIGVKYSFRDPGRIAPAIFFKLNDMRIHMEGSAPMRYLSQTIGVECSF